MKKIYSILICLLILSSCKKEEQKNPSNNHPVNTYSLVLNMNHFFGNDPLQLNAAPYINAHNDTLTVSVFRYYLSNFYLQKSDNSWKKMPDQYVLLDQSDPDSKIFSLDAVPEGSYKALRFMLGVDSLRNVSGAQNGALDPANNMFWDWNSGYIFIKLEGLSNQSPVGNYLYHLGGFSGNNNIIKYMDIPFGQTLNVNASASAQLFLHADVAEIFKNPSPIDLSLIHHVTGGNDMKTLANNYMDMFVLDSIKN
ncbi:MAG TPA: hypothetical protein PKH65_01340 [Bacteroidia bacterium]|nr:hypothetical protein [Bacteroidia bacterium]HNT79298.1 hypothetical protein [Bacteroidia bacterium]